MRATMRIPAWLVIGIIWAAGANADSLADATRSYRKNRVEFHDDTGKLSKQLQYWELTWIGE